MILYMSIWGYSWHCFLFTSSVVCSAKQDFYPPGISLSKVAVGYGASGLSSFGGSLGSCLLQSSPRVTQSLFFNLKPWLCDVSTPQDLTWFHSICREKGIVLATIFLPLTSAPQVKPSLTIHLGCSLCLRCTVHLSSLASLPVLKTSTSQSPMYFILSFFF